MYSESFNRETQPIEKKKYPLKECNSNQRPLIGKRVRFPHSILLLIHLNQAQEMKYF